MLEEEREAAREKAAQAAFEAERKAAEAAAAQEAREAYYKQEGQYDRSKDPRNDLDEGMKTETPSYQQLLLQGRKKRTEYKGKRVIRALSYEEVRASENFHRLWSGACGGLVRVAVPSKIPDYLSHAPWERTRLLQLGPMLVSVRGDM